MTSPPTNLNDALKVYEAAEANLSKLERLWNEIEKMIPESVAFGDETEGAYDDRCRSFVQVAKVLPKIDGWSMPVQLFDLNEIGQFRFDAMEYGEPLSGIHIEETIFEQRKFLQEYRYRLNKKRRDLVRSRVLRSLDEVDQLLARLNDSYPSEYEPIHEAVSGSEWDALVQSIATVDTLLGSSVKRPNRWQDLNRHIHFGLVQDLRDIVDHDWPAVQSGLEQCLYTDSDPIPVGVSDLAEVSDSDPSVEVVAKLDWTALDDDNFERLIFSLFRSSECYENPQWLTRTNAPDRGRDLSVERVFNDPLGGTRRERVIVQCKHWQSKSISLPDVVAMREQMRLWDQPRVDTFIIATSGRFTTDAIEWIEKHNQSDSGLRVEMWADSHLENVLAERPGVIAEFGLR